MNQEVESHITAKYEIKKRLGKGVSIHFSFQDAIRIKSKINNKLITCMYMYIAIY